MLKRLDFEESELVEREIGKFLAPRVLQADSNVEQFVKTMRLCAVNRPAALDFYRAVVGTPALPNDRARTFDVTFLSFCF